MSSPRALVLRASTFLDGPPTSPTCFPAGRGVAGMAVRDAPSELSNSRASRRPEENSARRTLAAVPRCSSSSGSSSSLRSRTSEAAETTGASSRLSMSRYESSR